LKEEKPYNPLDKKSLGISVAEALLIREPVPLAGIERFIGAGIYAIYYAGSFAPYKAIAIRTSGVASMRLFTLGRLFPLEQGKWSRARSDLERFSLTDFPNTQRASTGFFNLQIEDFYCAISCCG
jgi:hypothetical protein